MAEAKIVIESQVPAVLFTREAYVEMMSICRSTRIEVGWLGLVERLPDIGKRQAFRIYKAIVPPQRLANGATCEILDGELLQQLIDANRVEDIEKIRFWAHSHHSMSTSPSGQDEAMGIECINQAACSSVDPGWYITAIFNHAGDINIGFYDYRTGVKLSNIRYRIEGLADLEERVVQAKAMLPNADDQVLRQLCQKEIFAEIEVEIKARTEEVKEFVDTQIKKQNPYNSGPTVIGQGVVATGQGVMRNKLPEELDVRTYLGLKTKRDRKSYCKTFGYVYEDVEDMLKAMALSKSDKSQPVNKSNMFTKRTYTTRYGSTYSHAPAADIDEETSDYVLRNLTPNELNRFCFDNGITVEELSDPSLYPTPVLYPEEFDDFREAVARDQCTTYAFPEIKELIDA